MRDVDDPRSSGLSIGTLFRSAEDTMIEDNLWIVMIAVIVAFFFWQTRRA